jgi:hypothetical protein
MKPYGKVTKRVKSNNDKKGKWSRTEMANFLRRDKKKARQEAQKQIINEINEVR